jgi:hypothetical protein
LSIFFCAASNSKWLRSQFPWKLCEVYFHCPVLLRCAPHPAVARFVLGKHDAAAFRPTGICMHAAPCLLEEPHTLPAVLLPVQQLPQDRPSGCSLKPGIRSLFSRSNP